MKFLTRSLVCLTLAVTVAVSAYAKEDYKPKDFSIEVKTKGFPGARANVTARLDAPVEAIWKAVLDANTHGGKYPRMVASFCMSEADVMQAKKDGLRNGRTVQRRYAGKKCKPIEARAEGKQWDYHVYQQFDYPFPLSDRWIMAKAMNDETKLAQGKVTQTGKLIFGRQPTYEFKLTLSKAPGHPKQTKLDLYIWTDPGGIIADWMIKEATKYVAPKFMQVLEREGKKWMGR